MQYLYCHDFAKWFFCSRSSLSHYLLCIFWTASSTRKLLEDYCFRLWNDWDKFCFNAFYWSWSLYMYYFPNYVRFRLGVRHPISWEGIHDQGGRLVSRKATRLTTKNPKNDTFDDLFWPSEIEKFIKNSKKISRQNFPCCIFQEKSVPNLERAV